MTTYYDHEVGLAQVAIDAALAINEQVKRAPSQFTRQGKTSQWFNPRGEMLRGERTKFRVFDKGYRGARSTSFKTAANSEGPTPRGIGHTECSYSWDDLAMIRAGVKWNMLQDLKHQDLNLAVYELVNKLFSEAEADIAERENTGLMLSSNSALGTVTLAYDADGTTFSLASAHTPCFIRITDAPMSRFQKGDVLAIYEAASTGGTDVQNARVVVHDVIHGEDGPKVAGGTRVANIGPGLLIEPCDNDGKVEESNWTGATVTGGDITTTDTDGSFTSAAPAVGDFIARTGEFTTSSTSGTPNNIRGIPDWFDWNVGTLRDGDGTYLTRTDPGLEWTNPFVITPDNVTPGTVSTYVEFDPDEHLNELADNWIFKVKAGRAGRRTLGQGMPDGRNEQIQISEHLLAIMSPKLVNHVVNGSEDKQRFTHASLMNEKSAKALQLIGVSGFEGYVWHSPTLGEVCFQADTNCKPYTAFILEPSSWFWLEVPGGTSIKWLPFSGGSRIWAITGSAGGSYATGQGMPTFTRQAMAYSMRGLMCDQPAANAMIEGILTAREVG